MGGKREIDMKLKGELKEKVEKAESAAEAKDIIAEAGVELTDEEVADIAGGVYRNPNTRRPNDDTHIKAPKANGNYV